MSTSSDTPIPVLIVRSFAHAYLSYTRADYGLLPQIGAGPSGLAAALTLAQNGIPIRIIDKAVEFHKSSRGSGLHVRATPICVEALTDDERARLPAQNSRDLPFPWSCSGRSTPRPPFDADAAVQASRRYRAPWELEVDGRRDH